MKKEELQKGKWYLIRNYGFSRYIKGKMLEVYDKECLMLFYWGGLWRSKNVVCIDRLVSECERPSIFSNV